MGRITGSISGSATDILYDHGTKFSSVSLLGIYQFLIANLRGISPKVEAAKI